MENKRNSKVQTPRIHWNHKRHIPLVSLLLSHKIAVLYALFGILAVNVIHLVNEAVRQWMKPHIKFWRFLKIQYPAIWKCVIALKHNIWCKMDSVKVVFIACEWFLEVEFLVAGSTITPNPYLNSPIILYDKILINYCKGMWGWLLNDIETPKIHDT